MSLVSVCPAEYSHTSLKRLERFPTLATSSASGLRCLKRATRSTEDGRDVLLTHAFLPSVPVSRARLLFGPHLHAAHQRHATDVHLWRVGRQSLLTHVVGPA